VILYYVPVAEDLKQSPVDILSFSSSSCYMRTTRKLSSMKIAAKCQAFDFQVGTSCSI